MIYDEVHFNFCQNIRHLRKVHLLTQKEMAQIVGVSAGTLGRIEHCDPAVRIHSKIVCRVYNHFHVSSDSLLLENWPQIMADRHK